METKKNQEQAVAISQKAQALTLFPEIQSMASAFFESGLFTDVKSKAQAVVKIVAGQELGLPPLFSMLNIDIVLGRLRLNSQAIAALVKRSGRYDYRVKSHDDKGCVLMFTDGGKDVYESSFSIADAQRAGLVKPNSGWVMYPQAMLFARAVSHGAKVVCPHLMAGAEPLEDSGYEEVNGEIAKEGEPPPSAWRAYWVEAKREVERIQGHPLSDKEAEDAIHSFLGVASMKDWLSKGKSLEGALELLRNSAEGYPLLSIRSETETISPGYYKTPIHLISVEQQDEIRTLAKALRIKPGEEFDQVKKDAVGRVVNLSEMTEDEGNILIFYLEGMKEKG